MKTADDRETIVGRFAYQHNKQAYYLRPEHEMPFQNIYLLAL
jgi:hypothetical protein